MPATHSVALLAAAEDEPFVRRVATDLTRAGLAVTAVPEREARPALAADPRASLRAMLAPIEVYLVVLSPAGAASPMVRALLEVARELTVADPRTHGVVFLRAAPVPPEQMPWQTSIAFTVDLAGSSYAVGLRALLDLLARNGARWQPPEEQSGTAPWPPTAAGPAFGGSGEADSANEGISVTAGQDSAPSPARLESAPTTGSLWPPQPRPESAPWSAPPWGASSPPPPPVPDPAYPGYPAYPQQQPPTPSYEGGPLPPPPSAPLPGAAAPAPGWGAHHDGGAGWSWPPHPPDVSSLPRPTPSHGPERERTTAPITPVTPVTPPAPSALVTREVTFTAYAPREVQPRTWEPVLVYISLETPQALAAVAASAQERLAGRRDQFRPSAAAEGLRLRQGTQLTLVPRLPGFQWNPPELTVAWEEEVQQHEFRVQAANVPAGYSANGAIAVYSGPLLRAEIPLSIYVAQPGARADLPGVFARVVARAYRRVFASYSHHDTAVVRSCELAAETMGDRYLRDVTLLRGGELWDPRLLEAIGEADLFQLFWSEHAARSAAVAQEWRHALSLVPVRGPFLRPVYWSRQPYSIPPELQPYHFERLDLARLGWGALRRFVFTTLGGG